MTTINLTNYNALVDDDGSNTVGTIIDKAKLASVILTPVQDAVTALDAAIAAAGGTVVVQATSLTGTQHDFALTAACRLLRTTGGSALSLTGLAAGTDDQRLDVLNTGGAAVTFVNNSAGSSAVNRILTNTGADVTIAAAIGWAQLIYDAAATRWKVFATSAGGGAPLNSPTFTGTPAAPTAAASTTTTQLATTAFVMAQVTANAAAMPRAAVSNSIAQVIATATFTLITFDTEAFDVGAMHSTVSLTSRLTVPAGQGGLYLVTGTLTWAGNATGQRQGLILKNGSGVVTNVVGGSSVFEPQNVVAGLLLLAAGDYVELQGYQDSGGNLNTSAPKTGLQMVRLL